MRFINWSWRFIVYIFILKVNSFIQNEIVESLLKVTFPKLLKVNFLILK